ncbi:uncharacterized protein LOC125472893 [Pyrus x bretschneideri]|uniref:uncharacterized protein LOC125472893 n=1 Tax=Pyrus x bretschneideri TaxID=225117 RepID=UPI0020308ABC|nr:uncharacterized protein LOC125472893 [Pyrus x bretschneideri]
MSNCTVESCTVETSDGVKLSTWLFRPREEEDNKEGSPVVVLVHPYSVLGGCQGLLRGIAAGLADSGYKALTFDMRGVGRSTGRASLTGFAEIKDVISVCKWVCENLSADRILLVGSSAGAPIAGSAVDQIEQVVGYVSLGYPFGMLASILFGRHQKPYYDPQNPPARRQVLQELRWDAADKCSDRAKRGGGDRDIRAQPKLSVSEEVADPEGVDGDAAQGDEEPGAVGREGVCRVQPAGRGDFAAGFGDSYVSVSGGEDLFPGAPVAYVGWVIGSCHCPGLVSEIV